MEVAVAREYVARVLCRSRGYRGVGMVLAEALRLVWKVKSELEVSTKPSTSLHWLGPCLQIPSLEARRHSMSCYSTEASNCLPYAGPSRIVITWNVASAAKVHGRDSVKFIAMRHTDDGSPRQDNHIPERHTRYPGAVLYHFRTLKAGAPYRRQRQPNRGRHVLWFLLCVSCSP